jgi:hypothetical protein
LSSVLVKPLERLPQQTLGHVFYSPAPLFLALALLKRGVVLPEQSNILGYLVALQTNHADRCFLRIRGEGVS